MRSRSRWKTGIKPFITTGAALVASTGMACLPFDVGENGVCSTPPTVR
jgi:hypothetical protein